MIYYQFIIKQNNVNIILPRPHQQGEANRAKLGHKYIMLAILIYAHLR